MKRIQDEQIKVDWSILSMLNKGESSQLANISNWTLFFRFPIKIILRLKRIFFLYSLYLGLQQIGVFMRNELNYDFKFINTQIRELKRENEPSFYLRIVDQPRDIKCQPESKAFKYINHIFEIEHNWTGNQTRWYL